jgi:hypothetical protein
VNSIKELKDKIAEADDKESLLLLVQREQGTLFVVLKG